jgi:selenocysteine lyase/cysteine desulfurase
MEGATMEQSRRDFLKVVGKVTAGLGLTSLTGVQTPLTSGVRKASACSSGPVNWQDIRDNYFNLSRDYIYMNNSTMGPTLVPVSDRMAEVQKIFSAGCTLDKFSDFSDPNSILLQLSKVRTTMGSVVNTASTRIGMVDSVTEGMCLVANGLTFGRDDVIFITDHEHTGGRTMWEIQRDRYKAKLVQVPLLVDGVPEIHWKSDFLERFEDAIKYADGTPKVLSFPWITTSTGHVLPAKELCDLAIKYKMISVIDGAQAFTILPIDFTAVGCDFLVVNGHKYLCGPIGSGFVCVSPRVTSLPSEGVAFFWPTVTDENYYQPTSSRYWNPQRKSGITPYTNVLPLYEALSFYQDLGGPPPAQPGQNIGPQAVYDRLLQIGRWLRAGLSARKYAGKFELITPISSDISCVMTCFRIAGIPSETVYSTLKDQYGIQVKHSTEGFPANPDTKVVNGAVRISPHYYNTSEEFNKLAIALCEIAQVNKKYWPDFPG